MSDVVEISVALLRKFAEFTKKLTPEQLSAVASGDLKFGLLDGTGRTKPALPPVDIDQLRADLHAMTSRMEAANRIDKLGLTVPGLKDLARVLGVSISGVTKKDAIRDRIVEHAVGRRLTSSTLREGSWSDN
jgi:hypothetical protein